MNWLDSRAVRSKQDENETSRKKISPSGPRLNYRCLIYTYNFQRSLCREHYCRTALINNSLQEHLNFNQYSHTTTYAVNVDPQRNRKSTKKAFDTFKLETRLHIMMIFI